MNAADGSQTGSRIKLLLVDREITSTRLLQRHCQDILAHRLEHLAVADSYSTALTRLDETTYDLMLLDPALERDNGLELLAQPGAPGARTIIVSARADLALRAFDHGVLDFVPKPVNRARLSLAIHRLPPPRESVESADRFLAVRRLGRIDLVPVDDLLYVEGADKYSELVLASGQRSLHDNGLGLLADRLPPSFVRIHRSYLVRLDRVSRLVVLRGSRYFAVLENGTRLPVGRSHYARLKALLL
jgi:two-component system, LytTR family, response regulator LytT